MQRTSMVESLESRNLLAGSAVVAQQFIGGPDACTAIVLHFDRPLDPVSAQNKDAYELIRKFVKDDDGGFGSPIGGGGKGNKSSNNRIRIDTVVYDPADNTVRLNTLNTVVIRRTFTVIVVRGKGPNAVLEPGGAQLDGDANGRPGGDAILRFKTAAKKTFNYRAPDGDRVKFKVDGPGRIFYLFEKRRRSEPVIFTRDTNSSTILTATFKAGKRGDGVINVAQLGGTPFQNNVTDPPIHIRLDGLGS